MLKKAALRTNLLFKRYIEVIYMLFEL